MFPAFAASNKLLTSNRRANDILLYACIQSSLGLRPCAKRPCVTRSTNMLACPNKRAFTYPRNFPPRVSFRAVVQPGGPSI
jgi:hypothetical protein